MSDFYRNIFESAPIGVIVFDKNWIIKSVNKNAYRFGVLNSELDDELIDKSVAEEKLFTEVDITNELKSIADGEFFEKEIAQNSTAGGGEISVMIKGAPVYNQDSDYEGGVIIIEDVNVGKEASVKRLFNSHDFQNFLTGICDFYIITDTKGNLLYEPDPAVQAAPDWLGNDGFAEAFLGINDVQKLFKRALLSQLSQNEILSLSNGEDSYNISTELIPFGGTNSTAPLVVLLLKDVSKSSGHIEKLEESVAHMAKYEAITNTLADAVLYVDIGGDITYANPQAEELFGKPAKKLKGKFIGKLFTAIDREYFETLKQEVLTNKYWEGEVKNNDGDKEVEYYKLKLGLYEEENETTIVLLCTNITEQAAVERELKKSEERYRNIVTNSHEFICSLDLDGNLTYVNPHFIKSFGYEEEELLDSNFTNLIDPAYLLKKDFKIEGLHKGKTENLEIPLMKKNGEKIYVLASFNAALDLNGEPKYYNAILTDITVKKEAEKDLLLIRSVFNASQDGIIVSSNMRTVLVNENFARMFGYDSVKEAIGKDILTYVSEEDHERVKEYAASRGKGSKGQSRYDFKGKRKDGSIMDIENSVTTYRVENRIFTVSVLRDISEKKKAEEALKESEERYRSITENINESLWMAERKNRSLDVVLYTQAIENITGYTSDQFREDKGLWYKIVHPNDVQEFIRKLKRLYRDPARKSDHFEYRIINKLGNIIWIENTINVIRNNDGEIQKIYGLVSDVTLNKRAEAELKKSAENLMQLNDTKDRFISIVSHDLRTPFSSILGFTDILLSDRDMPVDKQIEYITFIQESSRNMLALVNSLLDWTRLQTGRIQFEPSRLNAKYVITRAVQMLSGTAIQKNVELVSDVVNDVYVHADENLLLQVFNNLISNAIKFTESGGSITVYAEPDSEKKHVRFSVKDTGVGIQPEDMNKLFKVDTKFTSPGTSGEKGSGLGLSLCYEIVQKHGGDVYVESEPGEGSEFIFTIPVSSTKLLLVDDSPKDRLLYQKLLKSIVPRYNIEQAENGKEAYDIIKSSYPALVITEHHMPVMSGYDMVKQILFSDLKFKPPIIVLSSDLNETIIEEYKELGIEYIFGKPVNLNAFKLAVDNSLKKAITS